MKTHQLNKFLYLSMLFIINSIGIFSQNFGNGTGSVSSPYQISTPEQLRALSDSVKNGNHYLGVYFELANDIIFNKTDLNYDLDGDKTNESNFIPIGGWPGTFNSNSQNWKNNFFSGNFDGKSHTIKNIIQQLVENKNSISYNYYPNFGLFGYIKGDSINEISIKNIRIDNSNHFNSNCGSATINTGIISARIKNKVIIDNCINTSISNTYSINGSGPKIFVGGICGYASGDCKITNCFNADSIKGSAIMQYSECHVGGIVGYCEASKITSCVNSGSITGSKLNWYRAYGDNNTGGICGESTMNTEINLCLNTGKIYAESQAGVGNVYSGGISGKSSTTLINNCINNGNISGKFLQDLTLDYDVGLIGGIVGSMDTISVIKNAINTGSVDRVFNLNIAGGINGGAGITYSETYVVDRYVRSFHSNIANISNCFYNNQICKYPANCDVSKIHSEDGNISFGKNTSYLTSADSIKTLPDSIWVLKNGYYPQLRIFANSENTVIKDASALGATAIYLTDKDSAWIVQRDLAVPAQDAAGNSLTWSLNENNGMILRNDSIIVLFTSSGVVSLFANRVSDNATKEFKLASKNIAGKNLGEGKGTIDDPFQITTVEQLRALSDSVGNGKHFSGVYFELANDIVFDKKDLKYDLNNDGIKDSNFKPIGGWTTPGGLNRYFSGNFNGNNHKLNNILTNIIYPQGNSNRSVFGGFFGYIIGVDSLNKSIIENIQIDSTCSFNIFVSGAQYLGSIAGYITNYVSINNCYNFSKTVFISSKQVITVIRAGGIVGASGNNCLISNCFNSDSIIYKSYYNNPQSTIGGIIGSISRSTVTNCVNKGNIVCEIDLRTQVGGIIGNMSYASISKCLNTGNLSVKSFDGGSEIYFDLGGIVGWNENSFINYCINNGNISGNIYKSSAGINGHGYAGGIVGQQDLTHINNCLFTAYIDRNSDVINCSAIDVSYNSWISNCFYDNQMCKYKGLINYDKSNSDGISQAVGKSTSILTSTNISDLPDSIWLLKQGYYPQLKAIAMHENSLFRQASALGAVPVYLALSDSIWNIKHNFVVPLQDANDNELIWTSSNDSILNIKDKKISLLKDNSKFSLTATRKSDNHIKTFEISIPTFTSDTVLIQSDSVPMPVVHAENKTLTIRNLEIGETYEIINSNGQMISKGIVNSETFNIALNRSGVFYVRVYKNIKKSKVAKGINY